MSQISYAILTLVLGATAIACAFWYTEHREEKEKEKDEELKAWIEREKRLLGMTDPKEFAKNKNGKKQNEK